jgi:putative ATP-dependent endonuclease of OLD family
LKTELTDRTRSQFKSNAQLYLEDDVSLPIQKYGAGTRSLFNLGFLTYIMGKRGRGILSLEEPETFLYPHAQRRVISEAKKISNQLFVTTHSPYVLEQFSSENLARVVRDGEGNVQIVYLDNTNQKFFKRHARKQMSEALLSNFVVVTEEDSMAKWLSGCSEILHGTQIEDCIIESFDLAGITVLSASGNGGVVEIAEFLESAGISSLICVDESKTVQNIERWKGAGKPYFTLPYTGLELLMTKEFPRDKILKFVTECNIQGVAALSKDRLLKEPEKFERESLEFLQRNKGSIPLHDYFISETNPNEVPETIKEILMKTVRVFKPNRPENAVNQL